MDFNINVEKRAERRKKSLIKNLRKSGYIPGIIYGEGKLGLNIKLRENEFIRVYNKSIGEVAFFDFKLTNKSYKTIIKEKQIHPVTRRILHIDFMEVHKGKPISISVPIKIIGEPNGVKKGGMLDVLIREVEVTCLPKDIPEDFEIDVSDLEIGDSIHIEDLDTKDLNTSQQPDVTVLHVLPPRKEEEVEVKEEETEEETEEIKETEKTEKE